MSKRFSKPSSTCLVVLVALMYMAGCSSNDPLLPLDQSQPPKLPPVSTMKMDLSFFASAPVSETSIQTGIVEQELLSQYPTKYNFINAAVRVLYVQLLVYAALEPPIAAFLVAAHSIPQQQPDGSWLWTYIFVDGDIEYSIFLRGKKLPDRTEWSMRVSSSDPDMPLDHFLWFEGEVMIDDSAGYWQFYEPADAMSVTVTSAEEVISETPGVPSVRIDYENLPGDTHMLAILVNKSGSPDEGDTVEFFESPALSYLEYHDVSEGLVANITWYADGSGSIEVPDYNNGEKACWDERQHDVSCSQ
ncbi:MAG: hypothetical protein GTO51_00235 [Candidatus Latescibacteria bacterium]|nr:hypothetical protein [Candidatus Latescibacterota bacterium]NIM64409.1 hypothetical protein [Candidatus Latescibacterota bacterium]NIO00563.1 hypothetical protein [Candidatus Latescibacterota bacterium]NIO26963.1 hypothetical protein [Candidatus Latescibacterota bacterium]NIO56040.1 hypothetical protein [Candidatus Latescibacterota bacterium]